MKKLFTLLLIGFSLSTLAVEFEQLSKFKPVEVIFAAEGKTYANIHLSLNPSKSLRRDIYLRASYIIGKDTLNDYVKVEEEFNGNLKQIFLDAGEELKVLLFLNNKDLGVIANEISGSLVVKKSESGAVNSEADENRFVGNIWRADETPIFRISKGNNEAKKLVVTLKLTQNFELDQLFLRAKVISPVQGIIVKSKAAQVHNEQFLPYKSKTLEIEFPEFDMTAAGSYYLQLSHQHKAHRLNGIQSISYELK